MPSPRCWPGWAVLLITAALCGRPPHVFAQSAQKAESLPAPRRATPAVQAPVLAPSILDDQVKPIDLGSALRLAGVQNPEIGLAQELVAEAVAARRLAAAQILPTLNVGSNFNAHTGPLQRSTGVITEVNRGALYAGMGAGAVGAGTVSVPGLVLSGNVSEG